MGKRKVRTLAEVEALVSEGPPVPGPEPEAVEVPSEPPNIPRRAKGTGSVSPLKRGGVWTGKWQARATLDTGASKSLGVFATHEAAAAACDDYYGVAAQRGRPQGHARRWTLLDAFNYWLDANPSKSGNSRRQYNAFRDGYLLANTDAAIRRGRRPIGGWALGDIDTDRARDWARALATEYTPEEREKKKRDHREKFGEEVEFLGLTEATISVQWALARRVYNWLIDEDHFDGKNPFRNSPQYEAGKITEVPDHDQPYIFTPQEIVELTLSARPPHALMLETLFWAGVRSGEVRALDHTDPLVELGMLRVDQALSAENVRTPALGPTKKGTKRFPHVPRRLLAALHARGQEARAAGETYLFLKTNLRTFLNENDIGDQMRAACRRAGITGDPDYVGPVPGRRYQPSPHDTRRTGISMHYAIRASVPDILAWAGHEQETTTLQFYARATRDRVLSFVASLHLDIEESWNMLYEMTWVVYGDPTIPPRYDLLTLDEAQKYTDWPLDQMQVLGAERDRRRQQVAELTGGEVYAEYLDDDADAVLTEAGANGAPSGANDPARRPANAPSA